MTNANETTPVPQSPARAVDHLILAFEKSGMRTFTEDGPDETTFVTISERKQRTDGTIGTVIRYVVEAASGKIIRMQVL